MTKISKKEVEHIARLAKIKITEKEKILFTDQFNIILRYFKIINKLNTERIPPTYHVLDITNVFREDKITPSLTFKDALKNASKKEKGFFKAPKIS